MMNNIRCLRFLSESKDAKKLAKYLASGNDFECGDASSVCFMTNCAKYDCSHSDVVEIFDESNKQKYCKRVVDIDLGICSLPLLCGADAYFPSLQSPEFSHESSSPKICTIRKIDSSHYTKIKEIRLAKLLIHTYPEPQAEELAVEQFFKQPRLLSQGQVLLIPLIEKNCKSPQFFSPNEHIRTEGQFLWYYVHGIDEESQAKLAPESPNSSLATAIVTAAFSTPSTTRIVLLPHADSVHSLASVPFHCQCFLFAAEFLISARRRLRQLQHIAESVKHAERMTGKRGSHNNLWTSFDKDYMGTLSCSFPGNFGEFISHRSEYPIVIHTDLLCSEGCDLDGDAVFRSSHRNLIPTGEFKKHIEQVLTHRALITSLCSCSRCPQNALRSVMSAASLVVSLCQSDTLESLDIHVRNVGAICVSRSFSSFAEFASGEVSDSDLTAQVGVDLYSLSAAPPSTPREFYTVNLVATKCPYILCIPGIHVSTQPNSSHNDLSYDTKCLNGLSAFTSRLTSALRARVAHHSGAKCMHSQGISGPTTMLSSDEMDGVSLICVIGITDQRGLVNSSLPLRDIFQHEFISEIIAGEAMTTFLDPTDAEFVSKRLETFAKEFGTKHADQYVHEVRLQCLRYQCESEEITPLLSFASGSQEKESMLSLDVACTQVESSYRSGGWLSEKDCLSSGSTGGRKQSALSSSSTALTVHWSDIGGLEKVREQIMDTLLLPRNFPELFSNHGSTTRHPAPRQTGILLFGPPGTGKTMVAKAVATECDMNFISIKGPELLDMYVGESEKHVRDLFQTAKQDAPCVMFFDELDSLAPCRSKQGAGGGVMDRVVSQLLTEIDSLQNMSAGSDENSDGESGNSCVFIIGATNRPDLLDPALMRPGRLDKKIYLGPFETEESKLQVIEAQTKKFILSDDVTCKDVVRLLDGKSVTGASIGAFTSRAYALAMERLIQSIEAKVDEELLYGGSVQDESRSEYDLEKLKHQGITNYINRKLEEENESHGSAEFRRGRGTGNALDVLVTLGDFQAAARDLSSVSFVQQSASNIGVGD